VTFQSKLKYFCMGAGSILALDVPGTGDFRRRLAAGRRLAKLKRFQQRAKRHVESNSSIPPLANGNYLEHLIEELDAGVDKVVAGNPEAMALKQLLGPVRYLVLRHPAVASTLVSNG
jgi:hypothetical protein